MSEEKRNDSIFDQVAERRSRNAELQSAAIERGIAVYEPASIEIDAPDEELIDLPPAFDMEALQNEVVSTSQLPDAEEELAEDLKFEETNEPEILEDAVEATESFGEEPQDEIAEEVEEIVENEPESLSLEEPTEELAELASEDSLVQEEQVAEVLDEVETVSEDASDFEEEPVAQIDDVAEEELEATEPVLAEEPTSEAEAEAVGEIEEPSSELDALSEEVDEESLIEQSVDLLGSEPETITDADVALAAEEIVDRIGPVVDIQSLPKSQPSRVLSKTSAKPKKDEEPVSKKQEQAPPVEKLPVEKVDAEASESQAKTPEPAPKKKKKKVSLLDSYFKGL